ncbi:MAG: hypothetical protein GX051_03585 [Clostridiales bacterium]|nr:hypothetical protein [Clostridiales bacterium]
MNNKAFDVSYDMYKLYMRQHIEGFNFYLVISGLLLKGIIDVLFSSAENAVVFTLLFCFIEALISIAFFLLDIRSSKYMSAAKRVLMTLENESKNSENEIYVIHLNEAERKKSKSRFRMTHLFRIVYISIFITSIVIALIRVFQ